MSELLVDLVVEEPGWDLALPDLHAIATQAATLALASAGLDPTTCTLCVLACNDARIAELNTEFRGKPAATNVLSWPAFELAPDRAGGQPDTPPAGTAAVPVMLGDVAIALQTMQSEAQHAATPLKNHTIHLILHGCLHLLGFDHETPEDAEMMEGIERRALKTIGIPDPYE